MKVVMSCLLTLLLAVGPALAADAPVELKTDEQKLSYALGRDLGEYFKGLDEKLDLDILKQAINDGYTGAKTALSEADSVTTKARCGPGAELTTSA